MEIRVTGLGPVRLYDQLRTFKFFACMHEYLAYANCVDQRAYRKQKAVTV
jgi:hypothetical protein